MAQDLIEEKIGDLGYISEYDEYDLDIFTGWFQRVHDKLAYYNTYGIYKKPFVKFESTKEPYEDWLGPVHVSIWGYRHKNEVEIQQEKNREEAEKLARELGTYVTAAEEILRLKALGKL